MKADHVAFAVRNHRNEPRRPNVGLRHHDLAAGLLDTTDDRIERPVAVQVDDERGGVRARQALRPATHQFECSRSGVARGTGHASDSAAVAALHRDGAGGARFQGSESCSPRCKRLNLSVCQRWPRRLPCARPSKRLGSRTLRDDSLPSRRRQREYSASAHRTGASGAFDDLHHRRRCRGWSEAALSAPSHRRARHRHLATLTRGYG